MMRFVAMTAGLLLAWTCIGANASSSEPKALADLKWRAMQHLAEGLAARLANEHPAQERVSLYVDVRVPHFQLQRASIWLDGERLAVRDYSRDSARALLDHAVHRLARVSVPPGAHRLRLAFSGRRLTGAFAGESDEGEVRIRFHKRDTPMALILPVSPGGVAPAKGWRVRTWEWRDEPADARLGMVRYLRATDRRFEALERLLTIRGGSAGDVPDGFHALMAHSFVDANMPVHAQRALARAEAVDSDRQTRNEAALRLAALEFRRGIYDGALDTLAAIADKLTPPQDLRRRDLRARILIARDQSEAALDTLAGAREPLTPHMRYNRAVALANSGRPASANDLLDDIGTQKAGTGIEPAVRDRANLALGYRHSRAGRPVSARLALVRVRPGGPYADKALLRLAWNAVDREGNRRGPRVRYAGFEFGSSSEQMRDVRQAMKAWMRLANGNPAAMVTQEALAARAFLGARMDRDKRAFETIASAVETLESTRESLATATRALRAGRRPRTITHADFGALPRTPTLARLRAGAAFWAARGDYRDLERLRQALRDLGRGDSPLTGALDEAAGRVVRRGQSLLADGVARQRERLDTYLTATRVTLARIQSRGIR